MRIKSITLDEAMNLVFNYDYVVCVEQCECPIFTRCPNGSGLIPAGTQIKEYYTLRASKHDRAVIHVSKAIAKKLNKLGCAVVPVVTVYSVKGVN